MIIIMILLKRIMSAHRLQQSKPHRAFKALRAASRSDQIMIKTRSDQRQEVIRYRATSTTEITMHICKGKMGGTTPSKQRKTGGESLPSNHRCARSS
jgi:hypothetical protein